MKSTLIFQEVLHHHLMKRRALCDAQTPDKLRRKRSLAGNSHLSIEEKKRKIARNLRHLESLGVVDSGNQYQDIINEMAKVRHTLWPFWIDGGQSRSGQMTDHR